MCVQHVYLVVISVLMLASVCYAMSVSMDGGRHQKREGVASPSEGSSDEI